MPRSRSPLRSLASTLDRSGALVALFDEQRQLIYVSAACGAWLGVNAGELIGRAAVYSSEPQREPLDTALARLAPPPDAFAGQPSAATLVGEGSSRRAQFLPLPVETNQWAVLMVAADDAATDHAELQERRASSDWHAALAQVRSQLPMSMQSEFLTGDSLQMRRLREQVQVAAKSRARVCIVGARGSGTVEIAATIHVLGGGRSEGLIPLHCPLQDAETLQAAIRALSRKRNAQPADRGPAILLRDVHLLPAAAQQELQGFLQLPGFEVRIVSTSRFSLPALAKKEKFSAELAALLTTLELRVPPLADRPGDVPLRAQLFLERFNAQGGKQFRGLTPEAIEQLVAYDWPENEEELSRTMAATCETAVGPWVIATDLPERLRANWQNLAHPRRVAEPIDLDAFLGEVEREVLSRALAQAKGNKSEAARLLGVSRPRLLRRLVQLKLVAKEDVIDFEPLPDEPSQEAS